jgi:hypothetical protein
MSVSPDQNRRSFLSMGQQLVLGSICGSSLLLTGCQRKRPVEEPWPVHGLRESWGLEKDWRTMDKDFWYSEHPRIEKWRTHYNQTRDPWLLWKKAQVYMPVITKIFAEYKLPNELSLLPMIESSFNPQARSQRAAGLWQFVKGTAKDMGLDVRPKLDERLDWEKSTVAAAKYLTFLAEKFDGDWGLVLASYNMGPGAIERTVIDQETRDYWQLQIREETTQYVPKFLAMIQLLRESFPDS